MKVAKLVTITLLTRVIVDEDATTEQIYDAAKDRFIDKLETELHENSYDDGIEDDVECPYSPMMDGEDEETRIKAFNSLKSITSEELQDFFEEEDFNVTVLENGEVEIETWTEGGVNMIHYLSSCTIEEFGNIVNDFDIDEEIDLHRQDPTYVAAFSIKQSVEDFTKYHNRLKTMLGKLK